MVVSAPFSPHPVLGALARAAGRLADLALPPVCVGCGREGSPLCADCCETLHGREGTPPGLPVGMPSHVPLPLVAHEWCVPYAGLGRAAIHALKYGGERRLAEPLGRALAARWREVGGSGDLFVPIPVHPARRRERGFDQAELLARAAACAAGVPWRSALERQRATTRQAELDRSARAANVAGSFVVRSDVSVAGSWIVLVDDVMTTGATLREAAVALHRAGAVAVTALTVARER